MNDEHDNQQTHPSSHPSNNSAVRKKAGAPKGNLNHLKHNETKLRQALQHIPLTAIDRRTAMGAELVRARGAIYEDLGGKENMSELQRDQVEAYLCMRVLRESLTSWAFKQPTLIKHRTRSAYPIVATLNQLLNSQSTLANAIGLQKKPRPAPDLASYIASKKQQKPTSQRKQPSGELSACNERNDGILFPEPAASAQGPARQDTSTPADPPFSFGGEVKSAREERNFSFVDHQEAEGAEECSVEVVNRRCIHCGALGEIESGKKPVCLRCGGTRFRDEAKPAVQIRDLNQ